MFRLMIMLVVVGVVAYEYICWKKRQSRREYLMYVVTGILIDEKVDELCAKTAIVVEDMYRGSDVPEDQIEQKKIERGSAIMTDVLLVNGIDPKKYNLPALIGIARVREGIDDLKCHLSEESVVEKENFRGR